MSKKILHTLTALILTGGFSMTAYAGGGEEYEATETPAPEPEETAEPSDPLTPEGNATLVDDIWGENKQLITVTTKNGNYFYILIDRAAEGENTVHFLNMVDEADLMALIEDGEKEETRAAPCALTTAIPVPAQRKKPSRKPKPSRKSQRTIKAQKACSCSFL